VNDWRDGTVQSVTHLVLVRLGRLWISVTRREMEAKHYILLVRFFALSFAAL
jgi:hypothetical protein